MVFVQAVCFDFILFFLVFFIPASLGFRANAANLRGRNLKAS